MLFDHAWPTVARLSRGPGPVERIVVSAVDPAAALIAVPVRRPHVISVRG
jgi:hypothetical protein